MTRRRRQSRLLSFPLAALAAVAIATSANAAVLNWSAPLLLREHRFVQIADAAFLTSQVAIVWAESNSVRVRTSEDGGATFAPANVFADSVHGRVAMCGGDVYVVYAHEVGANRVIEFVHGTAGQKLPASTTIAGGPGERVFPDVACTGSRVFVSWYEREGDHYRLYFSSALPDGSPFDAPTDLGLDVATDYLEGSAIAASGNMAYAFFGLGDGKLRVNRWAIGPNPAYAVKSLGNSVVVDGRQNRFAYAPVIEADADTVALAWGRCAGTYARVSHDGGATWEAERRIIHFGCRSIVEGGTAPLALAVDGDRMALSYVEAAIPNYQASFLRKTSSAFESHTRIKLGNHQDHFVGFMEIAGRDLLGDAYNTADQVKFRRQK